MYIEFQQWPLSRLLLWIAVAVGLGLYSCSKGDPQHNQPTSSPLTEPGIRFSDVTEQAGIRIKTVCGSLEKRYIVEAKGGGAAAFLDYDNDGDQDIYMINGSTLEGFPRGQEPTNALYRNNGDGTFTDVTEEAGVGDTGWGMGCVAADYDNDGDTDLYITNFGPNVLYRNNGDGTFTNVAKQAGVDDNRWGTGCAFGDYDKDGDLDLYVANYVHFDINYKPKYAKANIWKGIKVMYGPRGLEGAADIFYRNDGPDEHGVWRFTDVTEEAGVVDQSKAYGFAVLFGDYDNDGDQDIYVANDSVPNYLYRNNGDGTFTDVALMAGVGYSEDGREQAGMGAVFGDYDNDGWLDIFVTNFSDDNNTIYHNDRNGFFTDMAFLAGVGEPSLPFVSWGTGFIDYDNDGYKDLFVATGHVYPQVDLYDFGTSYAEPNQLYKNLRNGTFKDVSEEVDGGLLIKKVSRGAAFGDYDNDGDTDVIIMNLNETPTLLRNDGGNRNHWILFQTIGTQSNRSGVGARITVTTGGLTQMREVQAGSSFLCGNDLRVHFGLKHYKTVDRVTIRWPSGLKESFDHLPANRLIVLKEGAGIVEERRFEGTAQQVAWSQ